MGFMPGELPGQCNTGILIIHRVRLENHCENRFFLMGLQVSDTGDCEKHIFRKKCRPFMYLYLCVYV